MPAADWTVVIVDDTYDDLQIMVTTLEFHGRKVYSVSNARECTKLLNEVKPNVVITDLAMPDADGWAVLKCVRENPYTTSACVIAVTAYHSAKLADDVLSGGFDGYIPKPIDPGDFLQQLNSIIEDS